MNTKTKPAPTGYWTQLAVKQLSSQPGLQPDKAATAREKKLWAQLVALQAAANAVLSDVDDDGIAEAQDMAVLGLRQAVGGSSNVGAGKRVPASKIVDRRPNCGQHRLTGQMSSV